MRNEKAEAVHTITLIRDIVILIHPIICLTTLCTQLSACLSQLYVNIHCVIPRFGHKSRRNCRYFEKYFNGLLDHWELLLFCQFFGKLNCFSIKRRRGKKEEKIKTIIYQTISPAPPACIHNRSSCLPTWRIGLKWWTLNIAPPPSLPHTKYVPFIV